MGLLDSLFGGSTEITVPGMSEQEVDLLEKQGDLLNLYLDTLSSSQLEQKTYSDVLKDLSGLFETVTIPGKELPTNSTFSFSQQIVDNAQNIISNMDEEIQALASKGQNISRLEYLQQNLPSQLVDELIKNDPNVLQDGVRQKSSAKLSGKLNSFARQAIQNVDFAKQYGLANEEVTGGGFGPETTERRINQDAVAKLRSQLQETQSQQNEIQRLQLERTKRALEGTLPVSEGLLQRKRDTFEQLKENAARRGIGNIVGDTPETAVAQSTAAQQALGEFNTTFGLLEDAERRGELNSVPLALSTQPSSGLNFLSGSNNSANLIPQIGSGIQLAGNSILPFQNQRNMQFNANTQNVLNDAQLRSNIYGLGGLIGSSLILA